MPRCVNVGLRRATAWNVFDFSGAFKLTSHFTWGRGEFTVAGAAAGEGWDCERYRRHRSNAGGITSQVLNTASGTNYLGHTLGGATMSAGVWS